MDEPFLKPDMSPMRLIGKTIGELQAQPMSAWGNEDIIKGLKFSATLQLCTPLRVLLRHGEIHADRSRPPPNIVLEMWEGIWLPITSITAELPEYTVASDVGTILARDYLPFLVAVRRIIEANDSIEHRTRKLREMPIMTDWQIFLSKHGGIDGIIERFFPNFMNLAPSLNTPNRIAAASDETLLAIKGIGPKTLKAIRERCAGISEGRDSDRVENVTR